MGATTATRLHAWLHGLRPDDLPPEVEHMARRCLLDLTGTAAAGTQTRLSRIVRDHAVRQFGPGAGSPGARILFDGRRASATGAALAGGMTIDSVDAHDGHVLTKGHAGVAVLPAVLALLDDAGESVTGEELLVALVAGYEVAIRAGIALHATAPDYHTSGAWNALGVVAVASRLWGADEQHLREALGIAEYHGPRSQMMRCIDHPTMLKDGSGWGAMTGVSAAFLARDGFTGAPALTIEDDAVADLWSDLGARWRIMEMYFKPYPVCRWGQPAVEAALDARARASVDADAIEAVEVRTFHEGTRLDQHLPETTEQAQYSLPFPVAAALVRGRLVPGDIGDEALADPAVRAMSERIVLVDDPELSARFPAERFAQVTLRLRGGTTVTSDVLPARGDADAPLSDDEVRGKFHALADGPLGPAAGIVEEAIWGLEAGDRTTRLLELLLSSPG